MPQNNSAVPKYFINIFFHIRIRWNFTRKLRPKCHKWLKIRLSSFIMSNTNKPNQEEHEAKSDAWEESPQKLSREPQRGTDTCQLREEHVSTDTR